VYEQAPGFRPSPREREASACIRRHQAIALSPVRQRRFRVYKEAPGFRVGPKMNHMITWTLRCGQPRTKVTQCLERITLFTLSPSTASMCSILHQGLATSRHS